MSRLLDYIEVRATGKSYAQMPPIQYVAYEFHVTDAPIRFYDAKEYRVKATFGANAVVSSKELDTIGWEQIAKHKIYRPLAEEIFGEFRQPLLEADRAAYEGNYRKVSEIIHQVLDSMFKV